jgi:uncharacterized NAD-dependent epimerase/dehydratase family protein
MDIKHPYLLFLGDAADQLAAKTAQGIKDWRPEWCIGQLRLPGCKADLKLPDLTIEEARAKGARTVIIGVANRGGVFAPSWVAVMLDALGAGMDLASGLHNKLTDIPAVAAKAKELGRELFDVRHPKGDFPIATGAKRPGKRLLAVGTDCSIGKMYTALALEKEMLRRGRKASFRATGQTGIFIAGSGVSIDAVVADFISGAVETLAPANDPDHWDLVEGQGSLFHPSYAGVTMGLIHGSQADALVLCHEPTRKHMRGLPHYPLPDLKDCMALNLKAAQLVNPAVKFVAASINTSGLSPADGDAYLAKVEKEIGLPAVDPVRTGVGRIVDQLW